MRTMHPIRWSAVVIGVAVTVTGCSSASARPPTATKIVADMKAALARATSARIAEQLGSGQSEPINLVMTRSGDMRGLYSYDGVTTTVIVTRGRTYVLLNLAEYHYLAGSGKKLSAPCSVICGRYVLRSLARPPLQGYFSAYIHYFPLLLHVTAKTPVTAVTYQGQAAYEFPDASGDRIYISRADYPYPIADVSQGGTFRFSQWNAVPPITAPPASQVITEGSLFIPR